MPSPGHNDIQVNDKLSLNASDISGLMVDGQRPMPRAGWIIPKEFVDTVHEMHVKTMDVAAWPPRLQAVDADLRWKTRAAFGESDVRMCKNIGVDNERGAAAMAATWGRTFAAERDDRSGPEAKPQKRGQVSRRLKAELEDVLSIGGN
jgi:hypothetical protein